MLDVLPDEGLLVRSTYLRNDIKASALMAEARRRASDSVARAEETAEQVCRQARTDGYAAGILAAADELVEYLARHADFSAQLQANLQRELESILKRCVSDPDVIMAAFEECLGDKNSDVTTELDVLLPESMRGEHRRLAERLRKHVSGHVNIEYHQEARFLFRLGDHVAEFSPDDFVVRAALRAMSSLPSIYAANSSAAGKCRAALASVFEPDEYEIEESDTVSPEFVNPGQRYIDD